MSAAAAAAPEQVPPPQEQQHNEEVVEATPVPPTKPVQLASIYVGDLDPVVTEPQLVEIFKPFGTILNVRVCRDIISQRSLGYGYVNFENHDDAEKAIEALNFKRVGEKYMRLMWQQRDPALRYSGAGNIFVKNLEKKIDSRHLHDLFKTFGSILSCKVMSDEDGTSRGYGFVHFKEENSASSAIEKMNGAQDGADEKKALYVANFIRRNARLAALVANFTNVYIKQVLPTVDKAVIEKFFSKFGGITSAVANKDKSGRVFAFCNFAKHDDAVKAIEEMHEQSIEGITAPGEKLYVQRAQPRSERLIALRQKYMQNYSLGNNLYVRNFDVEFTDENLRDLFKEYGEIKSCRVMVDEKGNSRGFGFISFSNADQANAALREMNGRMLNGKPLVVNIAQRRDQRYTMLRMQFQQRLQVMMRQMQAMAFGGFPQQQGQGPRRQMRHAPQQQQGQGPRPQHSTPQQQPQQQQQQQQHATPQQQPQQQQQPRQRPATRAQAPAAPQQDGHRQFVGRGVGQQQQQELFSTPPIGVSAGRTPQQSPAVAPDTPPLPPITPEELSNMSASDQRAALGDRLYIRVAEISPEHAPKITGMFLEMNPKEAYELLSNNDLLRKKVMEALIVLKTYTGGKA